MDLRSARVACQIAGYHDDSAGMTRTIINSRISKKAAMENFRIGQQKKINGLGCSCAMCVESKK